MSRFIFVLPLLLIINSFSAMAHGDFRDCNEVWDEILVTSELQPVYSSLKYLCGDDFKRELAEIIKTNTDLGYSGARKVFFSDLDNVDGVVCGVYTGKCIKTSGIPNGSIMNCEHSWPQSKGAVGIAKSDLHHLFPADARMNSRRSNHPFCEVKKISYEGYGSFLGTSKSGTTCFEPPQDHKGDVARAMMYFSVRYKKAIDSEQEEFFRKWHEEDIVSEKEVIRNDGIEKYQFNRNPFIDQPLFVQLILDF